jgi:hypothetical protein
MVRACVIGLKRMILCTLANLLLYYVNEPRLMIYGVEKLLFTD